MRLIQFLFLLMIVLGSQSVQAELISPSRTHPSVSAIAWQECNDKRLNLYLQCGGNWALELHDNFLAIRISIFPMVQIQLERVDAKIIFLSQVTKEFLLKTTRYQPAFSVESFQGKHYPMIKVKAFDSFSSDIRLTDFYFLKNQTLYRMSFRVHPQQGWEEFQFIAQHVAWSLR